MSLQPIATRRRLRGAVGTALVTLLAFSAVAVLVALLVLMVRRASGPLFVSMGPFGAYLQRAQVLPVAANAVFAVALGAVLAAALVWLARRGTVAPGTAMSALHRGLPLAAGIAGASLPVVLAGDTSPVPILVFAGIGAALSQALRHRPHLLRPLRWGPVGAGLVLGFVHIAAIEPGLGLGDAPVPPLVVLGAWLVLTANLAVPRTASVRWDAATASRDAMLVASGVVVGAALLSFGEGLLAWSFLEGDTSYRPETAGIRVAILGTLWVGAASMVVAIPIGILAAVYLNEFARAGTVTSMLRASIANLAGVPSIVFGILGLAIFVRGLRLGGDEGLQLIPALGPSIAATGLTLGLLTLPIVIVVAEESLRSVPQSIREAAFGLGARRWQVVRHHVLPYALPGMLTGAILALSRTMGETAPLIVIGAATYITSVPDSPGDPYTALPIQAYYWAEQPSQAFHDLAWAAVVVLVALVLAANLAAIVLRDRVQRRTRW